MKNQFKTKIREVREANELFSQKSLAERLGVAQSTIGNWEAGTREPPYDKLLQIADEFKVSTDYLLGHQVFSDCNPDETVDMHRVTELRKHRNLTVEGLADEASIPVAELIKIESGKANPPANVIMKLSEALKSEPTDLLGYMWHVDPISPILKADEQLAEIYLSLNEEGKKKLLQYGNDLIDSGNYKSASRSSSKAAG